MLPCHVLQPYLSYVFLQLPLHRDSLHPVFRTVSQRCRFWHFFCFEYIYCLNQLIQVVERWPHPRRCHYKCRPFRQMLRLESVLRHLPGFLGASRWVCTIIIATVTDATSNLPFTFFRLLSKGPILKRNGTETSHLLHCTTAHFFLQHVTPQCDYMPARAAGITNVPALWHSTSNTTI